MKLRFGAFSFGLTAVLALEGIVIGQETERVRLSDQEDKSVAQEIQLPASVQIAKEEGIVNAAFPILPEFGVAPAHATPQTQNLAPLQSLLKLQGFEMVKEAQIYQNIDSVVHPAAEPVLGSPQLPSYISAPQTASFVPSAIQEEVQPPADASAEETESVESRMKRYLGSLPNQSDLFSGLDVKRPEGPTFMGVDERMTTEGVIDPWNGDVYCWTTPGFYHNPLYFEQVNLERYGQGAPPALQTLVSGGRFFSTIAILPYHIGNQPWDERVHTLGHYRPGNRNPHRFHYQRFTWKGVVYQVCATTGLVFAVP
jgi:hypothetical protein